MRYDLRLLESFVALADELHFGRAAEKLAFAQPALSQQIRRLETQVGSSLFVRNSRKVELTAAGEAFLPHARVSLSAAVEAGEAAAATERSLKGRLALSIGSDALNYIREFLRLFTAAHPDLQLEVTVDFDASSTAAVERHAVDAAALWSFADPPRGFEGAATLLASLGAGIAIRGSHPLAAFAAISLDQLRGQRLIMFPREPEPVLYDQLLAIYGGTEYVDAVDHIATIGRGVQLDMMALLDDGSVTPSPGWPADYRPPVGVVYRPLTPDAPTTLWLVWSGAATEPVRALAAFADQTAGRDLMPDLLDAVVGPPSSGWSKEP